MEYTQNRDGFSSFVQFVNNTPSLLIQPALALSIIKIERIISIIKAKIN